MTALRCTHIDAAMAKASCGKLGYFQDGHACMLACFAMLFDEMEF